MKGRNRDSEKGTIIKIRYGTLLLVYTSTLYSVTYGKLSPNAPTPQIRCSSQLRALSTLTHSVALKAHEKIDTQLEDTQRRLVSA